MSNAAQLEEAVCVYEMNSGLEAIFYRQVPKDAILDKKIEAARKDLQWYRTHVDETANRLSRAIEKAME